MGKIGTLKEFFVKHTDSFVNYEVKDGKHGFNLIFKNKVNDLVNIKSNYEIEIGFVETNDKLFLSDNLQVFMNSKNQKLLEDKKERIKNYLSKYGIDVDKNFLISKQTTEKDFVCDTINFVKAILTINKIK